MMFNRFKESLKPCSNNNLPPSYSQFSSFSQNPDSLNPRKPPKSNLSQQLQRLEDPISFPRYQPQYTQKQPPSLLRHEQCNKEEEEEKEEKDDIKQELSGTEKPRSDFLQFDHTGPFEPLALSPEGEVPLIQVPAAINCRLLEHQREGVKFLYHLYTNNHGGVLGDDMGLGKTIQTIAFLTAVCGKDGESSDITDRRGNQVAKKGPVIMCPTSFIHNWEIEFSKWASFSVFVYQGANRDLIIEKLQAQGVEVLITSFDTFRIHGGILAGIQWEVVIVDEAHRLKNEKSKLYIACLEIKTKKRFGLTGTIMQNKIMELFNLFDWVAPGSLGTREHFREFYDEPIKQGQRAAAPERFV